MSSEFTTEGLAELKAEALEMAKGGVNWSMDVGCNFLLGLIANTERQERLFIAACSDLGLVNEALGLDPEDGGAEPILDAIEELKAAVPQAQPVADAAPVETKPKDTPETMANSNARFAIDGAIQFGRENRNPPPNEDHWLYEYWNIGRQLAKLGDTGWDNVTPIPSPAHGDALSQQALDFDDDDAVLGLADNYADDSLENGNRVFDRGGLISFAAAICTHGAANGGWPQDFREVIAGAERAAHELGHIAGLKEAAEAAWQYRAADSLSQEEMRVVAGIRNAIRARAAKPAEGTPQDDDPFAEDDSAAIARSIARNKAKKGGAA